MKRDYCIPAQNLEAVERKVEKLNVRAEKLGVEPMTITDNGKDYTQILNALAGEKQTVLYHNISIEGEVPKMNGYDIFAKLEVIRDDVGSESVLIHQVQGDDIDRVPVKYTSATIARQCHHCNKTRRRKTTFLLRADPRGKNNFQDEILVGSTCMKDFTTNGDLFAEFASEFASIHSLAHNASTGDLIDWELIDKLYETKEFVTICAALGPFVSKTGPDGQGNVYNSTCHKAKEAYGNRRVSIAPAHRQMAEDALSWAREDLAAIPVESSTVNSYEHNLAAACQHDHLDDRTAPIAASLVHAYKKKDRPERNGRLISGHVGEVGEEIHTYVTVDKVWEKPSNFKEDSTYKVHRMHDRQGKSLVWFSTGSSLDEGVSYQIIASVTKHDTYRGMKQTYVKYLRTVYGGERGVDGRGNTTTYGEGK